jgi:hypothetical protein
MKTLKIKRWGKILMLPTLLLLLNVMFFQWSNRVTDAVLLQENFDEKIRAVDLFAVINDAVAVGAGWSQEEYTEFVSKATQALDDMPMTFAAAYQFADEQYVLVSNRHPSYEGSPFDPMQYPDFVELVTAQESGEYRAMFAPKGSEPREMWIHFQWVPTDPTMSNRYLIVVAISKYTVTNPVPSYVFTAQIITLAETFLLNVWLVVRQKELGYIRDLRKGEKWWSDED